MRLVVVDLEVFPNEWLFGFKDTETGKYHAIWNDVDKVKKFFEYYKDKAMLVGFNTSQYDNFIIAGILKGYSPQKLFQVSKEIVETPKGENKPSLRELYSIRGKLPILDLSQSVGMISLKEYEGFKGLMLDESDIAWDEQNITEEMKDNLWSYNKHDLDATEELFKDSVNWLQGKLGLMTQYNLPYDLLNKTDGGLIPKALNAQKVSFSDELDPYVIPKPIKNTVPEMVDFYTKNKLDYDKSLKIMLEGVEYIFGWGGAHASIPKYHKKGKLLQIDASSMYPTLMVLWNLLSRAIQGKDRDAYAKLYSDRLVLKAQGNPLANVFKLILNTTFGLTKDQYNMLFDPRMANLICITGQFVIMDLTLEVQKRGAKVVQVNTDGILIEYTDDNKSDIMQGVEEFSKRSKMTMETDEVAEIYQRDVNNYVMTYPNGAIKVKGGSVAQAQSSAHKIKSANKHRVTNRIVHTAVVAYLIDGVPLETTINNENDLREFQIIKKVGRSSYDKVVSGGKSVQHVNRLYASKNTSHGSLWKHNKDKAPNVWDKVPNAPEHLIIDNNCELTKFDDLDREWYIEQAKKTLLSFGIEI
ncbi:DNA polymerase [Weissella phage PWc]|nr:DNA polymerase [Weissella phage PWc]